ncbi:S1/P1 nuclease [Gaertneriomyces semiglobifer]|nr:S1/P1 nuclease [Gaertneriomyces semiglobifer]
MWKPVLLVPLWATLARAWGFEGHAVVGHIADTLVGQSTKSAVQQLLPEEWNLTVAANWADEVKKRPEYAWSYNLHFVGSKDVTPLDANSTHPVSCSIDLARDGSNGVNIVDAMQNYTQRLQPGRATSERMEALLFLSHFFGDVVQPLHTCGKLLGGNEFFAKWNGSETYVYNGRRSRYQLHVLWDVYIPEKDVKENFGGSWTAYTDWIIEAIQSGAFAEKKRTWWSSNSFDFALDSNQLNCNLVWDKDLLAGNGTVTSHDLAEQYYQQSYMVAREQLAKGGYRLATFLDHALGTSPNKCTPLASRTYRRGRSE